MKRILALVLLLCVCCSATAFAHSGRTDVSGGHRDNQDASGLGSYHYHHGYDAHLHPNGVCPYESAAEIPQEESTASEQSSAPNEPSASKTQDHFQNVIDAVKAQLCSLFL